MGRLEECERDPADGNIDTPRSEKYFQILSLGKQLRDSQEAGCFAGTSELVEEVLLVLRL